ERLENICGITYPQIFVKKLLTFTGTTKMLKIDVFCHFGILIRKESSTVITKFAFGRVFQN
ncbi:MAG: hypothetical protein JW883_00930, partial [Deltaproteobacteria bacterium]|nr:hypothetical protein [Deltaproteobacteria bacterium]